MRGRSPDLARSCFDRGRDTVPVVQRRRQRGDGTYRPLHDARVHFTNVRAMCIRRTSGHTIFDTVVHPKYIRSVQVTSPPPIRSLLVVRPCGLACRPLDGGGCTLRGSQAPLTSRVPSLLCQNDHDVFRCTHRPPRGRTTTQLHRGPRWGIRRRLLRCPSAFPWSVDQSGDFSA